LSNVEALASDAAIATIMQKSPSQLFLLDEIGRFLKSTSSRNSGSHLTGIVDVLLKLSSQANQEFEFKRYADEKRFTIVKQPNLCIYGTTTPDTLYKGLPVESITDGFLSRMMIFETDTPRPRKKKGFRDGIKPDKSLIDKIILYKKKPINCNPSGDLDILNPNPQIVMATNQAAIALEQFDDDIENLRDKLEVNHQIESVYSRTHQFAIQFALIRAIGIDHELPVISLDDAIWGIELAKFMSGRVFDVATNSMADNDYGHEVKRILNSIRRAGRMKHSELIRQTQSVQKHVRDGIIDTLLDAELISEYQIGIGAKKTHWYVAKENNILLEGNNV